MDVGRVTFAAAPSCMPVLWIRGRKEQARLDPYKQGKVLGSWSGSTYEQLPWSVGLGLSLVSPRGWPTAAVGQQDHSSGHS